MGQENFEKAELEFKKAIKLKSDFTIAYYNLGFILRNLGRLKEAESFNQKALEIDPQFTDAYSYYQQCNQVIKIKNGRNNFFLKIF